MTLETALMNLGSTPTIGQQNLHVVGPEYRLEPAKMADCDHLEVHLAFNTQRPQCLHVPFNPNHISKAGVAVVEVADDATTHRTIGPEKGRPQWKLKSMAMSIAFEGGQQVSTKTMVIPCAQESQSFMLLVFSETLVHIFDAQGRLQLYYGELADWIPAEERDASLGVLSPTCACSLIVASQKRTLVFVGSNQGHVITVSVPWERLRDDIRPLSCARMDSSPLGELVDIQTLQTHPTTGAVLTSHANGFLSWFDFDLPQPKSTDFCLRQVNAFQPVPKLVCMSVCMLNARCALAMMEDGSVCGVALKGKEMKVFDEVGAHQASISAYDHVAMKDGSHLLVTVAEDRSLLLWRWHPQRAETENQIELIKSHRLNVAYPTGVRFLWLQAKEDGKGMKAFVAVTFYSYSKLLLVALDSSSHK